MAVDVCSEIPSLSISPRISFSHDLNQPNLILLEDQDHHHHHHQHHHDRRRLDSSSDFDFCIVTEDDFTFEISSADELFSNGKILPVEIKTKDPPQPNLTTTLPLINNTNPEEKKPISNLISTTTHDNSSITSLDKKVIKLKPQKYTQSQNPSLLTNNSNSIGLDEKRIKLKNLGQTSSSSPLTSPEKKITRLKELLSSSIDTDDDEDKEKTRRNSTGAHKPFWQFRRSSSLNFEKIKSLHFMYSRSNSTGSVRPAGPPNPKPKPGLRKQQSLNSSAGRAAGYYKRTSSFSGGANNYYYNYGNNNNNNIAVSSKGNFPRKSNSTTCGAQYYHGNNINNGFRVVSPVLNLPQPYISKVTVSFFGFGSLFCNGKLRKKKK